MEVHCLLCSFRFEDFWPIPHTSSPFFLHVCLAVLLVSPPQPLPSLSFWTIQWALSIALIAGPRQAELFRYQKKCKTWKAFLVRRTPTSQSPSLLSAKVGIPPTPDRARIAISWNRGFRGQKPPFPLSPSQRPAKGVFCQKIPISSVVP